MTTQTTSRRSFLKTAAIGLGSTALACTGLGYAATLSPAIAMPEYLFGEEHPVDQRILVTYATRAGSTAEIAAAIGEVLSTRGFRVDVCPVKEQPQPDGYHAVLIGSAIRMGHWLPEAIEFIKTNQTALQALPTALFTVHLNNRGDDEQSRTNRAAYLENVRPLLPPVEEIFFAGTMDLGKLSFLDRTIAQMVKSDIGDFRDWTAIRTWARTVHV